MKIYIPKNDEIRERIANEVSFSEEYYTCNRNEYQFLKELSEKEYIHLPINTEEHKVGNVLIFDNGEICILDGLGYFKVDFK